MLFRSGVISDSKGDTISEFETSHNGMGRFYLFPVAGDEYTAIVRTGKIKRQC